MNGRRILVLGGMLLLLAGLIYAAVYMAIFFQVLAEMQLLNLQVALDMAVKGQAERARGYAQEFHYLQRRQLLHGLVSVHLILSGLIALAISSFIRALELKKKWEKMLSYLLILGGILSGAGFLAQLIGYSCFGWGMSLVGYVWLLIGVGGYVGMLALYVIAKPEP